jgi:ribosomal protein S18 acetylase RimI-like enzyme
MRWVLERTREVVPTAIVPLPDDRHHLTADFLARACVDHPLLPYLVPLRAARTRQALAHAGLALIELGIHCGEVDVTEGRLDGMAIWLTPGTTWASPARRLRVVRLAAALGLSADGFVRCLRTVHHLERTDHRLLPAARRELLLMAIHPDRRDKGIEDRLLQTGLRRSDADGLTTMTVCYRAAPVLFFGRAGFGVVGEGELPGAGPRYWLMARPPRG